MRVSCTYVILMLLSLQVLLANKGRGQNLDQINVTIGLQNQDLKTLFNEIKLQTGLTFAFSSKDMAGMPTVTLARATRSVKSTLDLALVGTQLKYELVAQNVIISRSAVNAAIAVPAAINVKGKITDPDGKALPGVSVFVKGTTRGTTTDIEGTYVITVDENDILVFTFIGFKTQEAGVNARGVIDVQMETDAKVLREAVVNAGYYETTDELKTGSIAKVSAKDIERQPVTNPLMALQGRAAGVDITPNTGVAGGAIQIQVRGRNSATPGVSFPLYIVDGVVIDSRPVASNNTAMLFDSGFDPLSMINPANIKSIEILKDADATAIYGSRGANGVILITTKQGSKSDKTDVTISAYQGVGKVTKFLDLLSTPQYLAMRREAYKNNGETPSGYNAADLLQWDTTRYTDWQKQLLGKSARTTDVQANVSSGNRNTSIRFGLGYHHEGMIVPGDFGYDRVSGNVSINNASTNNRFRSSLNVNYGIEQNKLSTGGNIMSDAITLAPVAPALYDENGNLNWENSTWINPLAKFRKSDTNKGNNIVANTTLSYELFRDLSIKISLGYTASNRDAVAKTNPFGAMDPATITNSTTATSTFSTDKRQSWIIEPQLVYNKKAGDHSLNALIGSTLQTSQSSHQLVEATGYSSDVLSETLSGATKTSYLQDNSTEYRYAALFTRIGYSFKDKYLLNLTGRRDGSSRFGPDRRWGNFGAVGVGWIFFKENFVQNFPVLSFGKIRGSYGVTGSDQIGDYKYLSTYSFMPYPYQNQVALMPSGLANSTYAWEQTKKIEVALELAFLKNRLSIEAARYQNRCSNQLLQYQLPGTAGFTNVTQNLDATVQNSGWEITINTANIERGSFTWTSSFNISIPKNKLVSYPGLELSTYKDQYVVGQSVNIAKLYNYKGVNPTTGLYEVQDVNGDGILDTQDATYVQNIDRKYYGGLSNTFQYKGFELSFLFQFSNQVKINVDRFPSAGYNQGNAIKDVINDHWKHEGDNAKYQVFTTNYAVVDPRIYAAYSNGAAEKNAFARLKTVSLSYRLQGGALDKLSLKSLKIYTQGQNIATITKYSQLDPETGNLLPPLRIITYGLEVTF